MRKCVFFFIVLIATMLLFKMSTSNSDDTLDTSASEEVISLPENNIAEN